MSTESKVMNGTEKTQDLLLPGEAKQKPVILNGNEAAAQAVLDIGFDGEGYYPITPSSEVGEMISKHVAAGKNDMSFVVGTS